MIDTSKTPYVLPVLFEEGDPNVRYRWFVDYPGYAIGEDGSVWSCRGCIYDGRKGGSTATMLSAYRRLQPIVMKVGYQTAALRVGKKAVKEYVHSLVLHAFVGPRPNGYEGCHGDGNRVNNALANLRWDSPSGNHADMKSHGTSQEGSKHGMSKLTESDVTAIRHAARNGGTLSGIAAEFGTGQANVSMIVRLKAWKHVPVDDEYREWLSSWNATVGRNSGAITADCVRAIRSCGDSNKELAQRYGVSVCTIGAIRRGTAWKNVQ